MSFDPSTSSSSSYSNPPNPFQSFTILSEKQPERYEFWKSQIFRILYEEGVKPDQRHGNAAAIASESLKECWNEVLKTITPADIPAPADGGVQLTALQYYATLSEEEKEVWRNPAYQTNQRKPITVRNIIMNRMEDVLQQEYMGVKSCSDLWERIRIKFSRSVVGEQERVTTMITQAKQKEGEKMMVYIRRFQQSVDKAKSLKIEGITTDHLQKTFLLNGVLSIYQDAIKAMKNSTEFAKMNIQQVIERLMMMEEEEDRLCNKAAGGEERSGRRHAAMLARPTSMEEDKEDRRGEAAFAGGGSGRGGRRGGFGGHAGKRSSPRSSQRPYPSPSSSSTFTCHFCHKPGHYARDCWLSDPSKKKGTKCVRCDKMGHTAAVCTAPPKQMAALAATAPRQKMRHIQHKGQGGRGGKQKFIRPKGSNRANMASEETDESQ